MCTTPLYKIGSVISGNGWPGKKPNGAAPAAYTGGGGLPFSAATVMPLGPPKQIGSAPNFFAMFGAKNG